MRITDLLTEDTIILDLKAQTKKEVIEELANVLEKTGKLHDRETFIEAIFAREAQSTTGIGEGIAIPHAKTKAVRTPAVVFGRSKDGIDYDALDGKQSHLFFMIAAPEGANNTHLEALSRLSTLLMDSSFRSKIENALTKQQVIQAIQEGSVKKSMKSHHGLPFEGK